MSNTEPEARLEELQLQLPALRVEHDQLGGAGRFWLVLAAVAQQLRQLSG